MKPAGESLRREQTPAAGRGSRTSSPSHIPTDSRAESRGREGPPRRRGRPRQIRDNDRGESLRGGQAPAAGATTGAGPAGREARRARARPYRRGFARGGARSENPLSHTHRPASGVARAGGTSAAPRATPTNPRQRPRGESLRRGQTPAAGATTRAGPAGREARRARARPYRIGFARGGARSENPLSHTHRPASGVARAGGTSAAPRATPTNSRH